MLFFEKNVSVWSGFFILLLLVSGCAETQAQTFTPTPTRLPTPTRFPTLTPVPSPTPFLPATGGDCPYPDLWPGLHLSASGSYTETETQAAGPIGCRIERDSCAYARLIVNRDTGLIFKREEIPPYDEEDMLFHPAVLLPLTRLDQLVRAEWGGFYQLRVTDAYDSLLEHDLGQADEQRRASLHFEGRAVDLTTWPLDKSRYPRLCTLAHCAGFDWVHNEGDHCHASLKAGSLCFSCKDE